MGEKNKKTLLSHKTIFKTWHDSQLRFLSNCETYSTSKVSNPLLIVIFYCKTTSFFPSPIRE